jgi:hypothetical protein
MTVDIFIRSYRGDFNWLGYCLQSISKYAVGFNKVHLCIPANDIGLLPKGDEVVHLVNGWEDDYIGQQYDKLTCDHFCNAPYIMILDSDCVLTNTLNAEDLFREGKPVWLYESVPDGDSPWPEIVEEAIGWRMEYDFMRRHPFVVSRRSLVDFRAFMFNKHKEALNVWLKKRPYRRFSEFNSFGAWAYKCYYDHFSWLPPQEFPSYLKQYWSWGGTNDIIRSEIEKILAD